jgi:hypothetical protein
VLFAEVEGRKYVLTSALERNSMARALPEAEVLDYLALGFKELVEGGMSFAEAEREAVARAVREIGIGEAVVPGDLPLALGDGLREIGVVVTVDDAAVEARRGRRRRLSWRGSAPRRRRPRRARRATRRDRRAGHRARAGQRAAPRRPMHPERPLVAT